MWRPIAHPVVHHPLAVTDWRSLDPEKDLVPTPLIYPDQEGATFSVRYSPFAPVVLPGRTDAR
jgi:hypothetical protein